MNEISKCPKCGGEYVYFDGSLYVCPDCAYEFEEVASATEGGVDVPKDSNGVELLDGDAVTVIDATNVADPAVLGGVGCANYLDTMHHFSTVLAQ